MKSLLELDTDVVCFLTVWGALFWPSGDRRVSADRWDGHVYDASYKCSLLVATLKGPRDRHWPELDIIEPFVKSLYGPWNDKLTIHLWLEASNFFLSNKQEKRKADIEDPHYSISQYWNIWHMQKTPNSRIYILFRQMKHCPVYIIRQVTEQISINFKGLKTYKLFSLSTMELAKTNLRNPRPT